MPYTVTPRKGIVHIFNYEKYERGANTRTGSATDVENLQKVFSSKLGFAVNIHNDLTKHETEERLRDITQAEKTAGLHIAVILAHGLNGQIRCTDGAIVPTDSFVSAFASNAALAGHPKIIIFQACRTPTREPSAAATAAPSRLNVRIDQVESDAEICSDMAIEVDHHRDVLVGFSTVCHYESFRHITTGSFFIQYLCEALHADVLDMSDVQHYVTNKLSGESMPEGYRQVSIWKSTLAKRLVLPCFKSGTSD